jgi:Protein of unknown function with PCYCGC motif
MNRALSVFLLVVVLGTMSILGAARSAVSGIAPTARASSSFAYPDEPQIDLPETLPPDQFQDNHPAFVAYTLASRIKTVIRQVPCYCGCDKEQGHKSLLDCFTGRHGVLCHLCQKEVIFCYLQQKKGKQIEEIRDAMAKGKASRIDLTRRTNSLYREIQKMRP